MPSASSSECRSEPQTAETNLVNNARARHRRHLPAGQPDTPNLLKKLSQDSNKFDRWPKVGRSHRRGGGGLGTRLGAERDRSWGRVWGQRGSSRFGPASTKLGRIRSTHTEAASGLLRRPMLRRCCSHCGASAQWWAMFDATVSCGRRCAIGCDGPLNNACPCSRSPGSRPHNLPAHPKPRSSRGPTAPATGPLVREVPNR